MSKINYDLCIIGNGPAGMTASIYASRYKINHIIAGDYPGGLMTSSHKICNFPSQPDISGFDLTQKIQKQVESFSVPQKFSTVKIISKKNNKFIIKFTNGDVINAKRILLATGTKHRHLGIDNEDKLTGKGVSYCATCDAMFYKDKIVAVIGGSDSANTASLYLAQVAKKVYQIYRKDKLRGETAWIEQIKSNKKIIVIYNTNVTKLIGKGKLNKIKLDKSFYNKDKLNVDGVFVEIGSVPENLLIKQLSLETDEKGYVKTNKNQTTSEENIWAAGDITTGSNNFRQIITACSEGAIAAEDIYKNIQSSR